MRRSYKLLIDAVIIGLVVAGGYWAYLNHNQLLDWYYLRDYTAPERVASLATQATMTDDGRRLFYRAHPEIDPDRNGLQGHCNIADNTTIELGCYLSNDKIYLLDIQQPELADEMVVTAAHETLHAVYDRLSKAEKQQLNSELEDAAAKVTDSKLQERLNDYDKVEPGERDNELHSILGSEYRNLSPQLEAHYAKYFSNRAQILAFSDSFNRTFDGLHDQIQALDAHIKATRAQMSMYLSHGQTNIYNSLVPTINKDITVYNQKVELYNKYANSLLGTEQAQPTQ